MQNIIKALATIILVVAMVCAAGCNKEPQVYNVNVSASPSVGGVVMGGGNHEEGQSCIVTAMANDDFVFYYWSEANDYYLIEAKEWVSFDTSYSFIVDRNRDLVAHFAMSNDDGHAYVDLGLPSGLLWATCNIGATSPEDYGNYFAWGETTPKDIYNWSTYQHSNGSSYFTKYCQFSSLGYNGFTDDLTVLLPEDDAAAANWDNGWRMPTKEEFEELYNNTIDIWTEMNGVCGRLFSAANGASLFLPAAGSRNDSSLYDVGTKCYYWSSSLQDDSFYAWHLDFSSGLCGMYYFDKWRIDGLSVRAVRAN